MIGDEKAKWAAGLLCEGLINTYSVVTPLLHFLKFAIKWEIAICHSEMNGPPCFSVRFSIQKLVWGQFVNPISKIPFLPGPPG